MNIEVDIKQQIHNLVDAYAKKSQKLRDKADKNIFDNRAYVAYNSEADLIDVIMFDLKAIVKCKECGNIQCDCHEAF